MMSDKQYQANLITIAGREFIRFPQADGLIPMVMKDVWRWAEFGHSNNLAESRVLKLLNEELLPELEAAMRGTWETVAFDTNLLSMDGDDRYGTLRSKISLPTYDFYRANVRLFDAYPPAGKDWWWLATPDSTERHRSSFSVRCVNPKGILGLANCTNEEGVRPMICVSNNTF